MKRYGERDLPVRMLQSNVTSSLASDFPSVAFEGFDQTLSGYDRQGRSRRDRELTPDHPSFERAPVFAYPFDVECKCLLRIRSRLIERVALGVQAWKVRGVDVVAALVLRGEDKLDLSWLIHRVQDRCDFSRGQGESSGDGARRP
jgi:hypothetical protein